MPRSLPARLACSSMKLRSRDFGDCAPETAASVKLLYSSMKLRSRDFGDEMAQRDRLIVHAVLNEAPKPRLRRFGVDTLLAFQLAILNEAPKPRLRR